MFIGAWKICLFKLHFIPQWEMFIEASDILHIQSCLYMYILSFPVLFLVYGFSVGFSFLYFMFLLLRFQIFIKLFLK